MPNFTPNFKLKKPLQSENYNIDDFNSNVDILDTELLKTNNDINNKVNTVKTDLTNTINSNNNVLNAKIDKANLDLNVKIQDTNTRLDNAKTDLTTSINTNINTVNKKIDDIQVGGMNLLYDTSFKYGTDRTFWCLNRGTSHVVDEGKIKIDYIANSNYMPVLYNSINFPLEDDIEYTISFFARIYGNNSEGSITFLADGGVDSTDLTTFKNLKTDNYKKCTLTFKLKGIKDKEHIAFNFYMPVKDLKIGDAGMFIKDIVLVEGNKAPSWSPSPKDIIYYNETQKDISYYVNPVTGNDDVNNGLALTVPFKTINKAISMIPPVVNHEININLVKGTYNENVILKNKHGAGTINFFYKDEVTDDILIRDSFQILDVNVKTYLRGLKAYGNSRTAFEVINSNNISLESCRISDNPGPNSDKTNIYIQMSRVNLYSCNSMNAQIGIDADFCSHVQVDSCDGYNNNFGMVSRRGSIVVVSNGDGVQGNANYATRNGLMWIKGSLRGDISQG